MASDRDQNWIAFGAAALGAVLLLMTLAVDWGELRFSASGPFGDIRSEEGYTLFSLDETGWYDSDLDDMDGIGTIRAAIPLAVAGIVGTVLGVVFLAVPRGSMASAGRVGGVVVIVGGILVIMGAVLHFIGVSELADSSTGSAGGASSTGDVAMGIGSILAETAGVLAIAGGIIGFVWNPLSSRRGAASR